MAIGVSEGGTFRQAPEGSHVARCVRVIDLGTQEGEWQGQKTLKRQVMLTWELPGEATDDGEPMLVSGWYTASLGEKAKLRGLLETWRGKQFTADELRRFELDTVLGAPCLLAIVHSDSGKARVSSVMKLPKGMAVPDQVNPAILVSLDPYEFKPAMFDMLSDKMKSMIARSPEYQRLVDTPAPVKASALPGTIDDLDDDVPFLYDANLLYTPAVSRQKMRSVRGRPLQGVWGIETGC